MGVRGATNACGKSGLTASGAGSARLSILPFGNKGNSRRITNDAGTMCSGNRSFRKLLNCGPNCRACFPSSGWFTNSFRDFAATCSNGK